MSRRSIPETMEFKIIDQSQKKYFVFADPQQDSQDAETSGNREQI